VGGDLLEVVEDDQGLAATMQGVADLVDVLFGFTRVKGDAEGLGDGLKHLGEGITFAEIAKPDTTVKLVDLLEAEVLCKTGFPCATRAKERDESFAACVSILDILEFLVSSDKAFVGRADVGLLELGSRQARKLRTKKRAIDDGSFFFFFFMFIKVRGGRQKVAFDLDWGYVGLLGSVVLDARLCAGVRVGGSAGSV